MTPLPFPEDLRRVVENEPWTFAKTYAQTWPHEYLVRDRVDERLFLALVTHIREHGYAGWFYRKPITYFDEAGMVYWTMGAPIDETTVVNRCRKGDSYESRLKAGTLPEQRAHETETGSEDGTVCFPMDVMEAQTVCALRFRGYEYVEALRSASSEPKSIGLAELTRPIIETLTLHDDQAHNHAAFFGLQRFLHKWGGEQLTKFSAEHVAYDFLFLHLYGVDPPPAYADQRYTEQWTKQFIDRIEPIAACVRMSFRHKGRGERVHV